MLAEPPVTPDASTARQWAVDELAEKGSAILDERNRSIVALSEERVVLAIGGLDASGNRA